MTYVLCWDIDGTLLTTGRAGIFAWQDALHDVCGLELDLDTFPTSGLTDAQIAENVLRDAGVEPSPENADAVLRRYEELLPTRLHLRRGGPLPGVVEILESFDARDDVLNVLLTGNTPAGARAKLEHYGLTPFFPCGAFCEGSGPRDGIATRALTLAAERLGAVPHADRTYVIGDTPHDVRCGKSIGARTVAVASGGVAAAELAEAEPWLLLDALPAPSAFVSLLGMPPA